MPIFGTIVADGTAATSSKQRDLTIPLLLVVAVAILVLPQILNGKTTNMAQSQADESSDTLMAIDLVGGSIPAVVYSEKELEERGNARDAELATRERQDHDLVSRSLHIDSVPPALSDGDFDTKIFVKEPVKLNLPVTLRVALYTRGYTESLEGMRVELELASGKRRVDKLPFEYQWGEFETGEAVRSVTVLPPPEGAEICDCLIVPVPS